MKKFSFLLFGILIATALALYFYPFKKNNQTTPPPDVLGVPTENFKNSLDLAWQGKDLRILWSDKIEGIDVELFPNFKEKLAANEFQEKNSCQVLISGGFYTDRGEPTGLFIHNGQTLKKESQNALFNGFFSVNYLDTPRITPSVPRDPLRVGLQSGPLLIENSFIKKLSMVRDEEARRIVVATTGENKVIFFAIFNPESVFEGPLLKDLPEILGKFQEKTQISLADAINLDGGSASAFIVDPINLSEVSPVGSFFCVQE